MGSGQKEPNQGQYLTPVDLAKKKVSTVDLDHFKFTKSDQSMSSGSGATPLADKKSDKSAETIGKLSIGAQPQEENKVVTQIGISGTENRVKIDKT